MKSGLSVVMVTKNSEALLDQSLNSVKGLAREIIIVDGNSTDRTLKIAREHDAKIFQFPVEDQGLKKNYGLHKSTCDWVLILDSDEIIGSLLRKEIIKVISSKSDFTSYLIPYNNHFLRKPLKYGGENYKILRLFKRKLAIIKPAVDHEKVEIVSGRTGLLRNKIDHYSYQSLYQVFSKFTRYARSAAMQKVASGESVNIKKIILYPLHMFWARFVENKGYQDGFFRLPLDLGFAYMEFLTYLFMLFKKADHSDESIHRV